MKNPALEQNVSPHTVGMLSRRHGIICSMRIRILTAVLLAAPVVTFAQDTTWLNSLARELLQLVSNAVGLLSAVALLVFIWGVVMFIANTSDDEKRAAGKKKMVWGIIALFVLVSVWGLVLLIRQITGIGPETLIAPRAGLSG